MYLRSGDVTDTLNIKSINIATDGFDIRVEPNKACVDVDAAMVNKSYGYVHKSKANASFTLKFDNETGALVFNVVEPDGWISKKNCYIVIAIPESLLDACIDIEAKSEKGDISIGGKEQLCANNIVIQSEKGDSSLINLSVDGTLDFDIGSGLVFVDEQCVGQDVDVNISLGSGKVNMTRIGDLDIGTVEVDKIKSGTIGILKAFELVTERDIRGGGRIDIGEVKVLEISTLDTNVKVGTLGVIGSESSLPSRIDISGNGDIEILRAYSNLQISGHNGNVKIEKVTGDISLTTNQGDVEIYNAYKNVAIDTQYGTAKIYFSDDAPQYYAGGRVLVAGTKNGHIISKGLQNASVTVRDKGRVTLDYNAVRGMNLITADTIGSVDIVVPAKVNASDNVAINLKVKSEVKPDIKVGTVSSLQAVINNGEYILDVDNIYGTAGINTLKIETAAGNVKVRSRNLIDF